MAENSKIEWTDHTFNPWIGCTKVHAGCTHCYAETLMDHRYGKAKWGVNGTRNRTSVANWRKPLQWNRAAEKAGRPALVFCASLADVFDDWTGPISQWVDGAPDQLMKCPCGYRGFRSVIVRQLSPQKTTDDCPRCGVRLEQQTLADVRRDLFALIDHTPNLIWLMLTKRPENVRRMWPEMHTERPIFPGMPGPMGQPMRCVVTMANRSNVWIGTSPCNQETADAAIPELLKVRDLCGGLFLSCEPLVGPLHFGSSNWNHGNFDPEFDVGINWVITGGESGHSSRPTNPEWFRSIRDQCQAAGVPYFHKQNGEWVDECHPECHDENGYVASFEQSEAFVEKEYDDEGHAIDYRGVYMLKVGKARAGRLLDGREWSEFPAAFMREVSPCRD